MVQTSLFSWAGKRKVEAEGEDTEVAKEEIAVEKEGKVKDVALKNAEWCQLELAYLEQSWLKILQKEFDKPYFIAKNQQERVCILQAFLIDQDELIYSWAAYCPFDAVKVVIIGQDPYHDKGQAMGLCFSVPPSVRVPPSLLNIYQELSNDIEGFIPPKHGCLIGWAQQGVLLLNSSLTVRAHQAASHANRGWEQLTDATISALNAEKTNLVFLLWGNHAIKKGQKIDKQKHLVLQGVHPSPLSASRGFFGCKHFSKTNEYLAKHGIKPIDWHLQKEAN